MKSKSVAARKCVVAGVSLLVAATLSACSIGNSPAQPGQNQSGQAQSTPGQSATSPSNDTATVVVEKRKPGRGKPEPASSESTLKVVEELVDPNPSTGPEVLGAGSWHVNGVKTEQLSTAPRLKHITKVNLVVGCVGSGTLRVTSFAAAGKNKEETTLRCSDEGEIVQFFHEVGLDDHPNFEMVPEEGTTGSVAYSYRSLVFWDDPKDDPLVKPTK